MIKFSRTKFTVFSAFLSLLWLAACVGQPQPTPDATAAALTNVPPTPTAQPSPTALPPAAWLIAPESADAALVEQVNSVLANQNGLTVSSFPQFTAPDAAANLQLAIFIESGADVAALAASLPEVQFVAIGANLPAASANLSVIDAQLAERSFLLGYIATLVAPDFRSGALLVDSDPDLALKQDSFMNGGRYLCGRCIPVYTPLVVFPQTATVSASADAAGLQSAFDTFNQNRFEVLSLPAQVLQPDFLAYLSSQNVLLLGLQAPPDDYLPRWVVTVQADVATPLAGLLPTLLNGEGGQSAKAELSLANVNEAYLTAGKLSMVTEIIAEIQDGWISVVSLP